MKNVMHPIAYLVDLILSLYSSAVFIWLIMGWLMSLGILNRHSEIVGSIFGVVSRILNPVLFFIRKYVPLVYGVDLSPLILLMAINFFRYTLRYYLS